MGAPVLPHDRRLCPPDHAGGGPRERPSRTSVTGRQMFKVCRCESRPAATSSPTIAIATGERPVRILGRNQWRPREQTLRRARVRPTTATGTHPPTPHRGLHPSRLRRRTRSGRSGPGATSPGSEGILVGFAALVILGGISSAAHSSSSSSGGGSNSASSGGSLAPPNCRTARGGGIRTQHCEPHLCRESCHAAGYPKPDRPGPSPDPVDAAAASRAAPGHRQPV